jgi:hypothetical protein
VGQSGNRRGRPILTRTRAQVNQAGPEGSSNTLPWEISSFLRATRSRASATAFEERGEVSRGHSNWLRNGQRKRAKPTADFLMGLGVPELRAWLLALSGKGWWRLSGSPPANEAMTLRWFNSIGLINLSTYHAALQPAGNRRVR